MSSNDNNHQVPELARLHERHSGLTQRFPKPMRRRPQCAMRFGLDQQFARMAAKIDYIPLNARAPQRVEDDVERHLAANAELRLMVGRLAEKPVNRPTGGPQARIGAGVKGAQATDSAAFLEWCARLGSNQ